MPSAITPAITLLVAMLAADAAPAETKTVQSGFDQRSFAYQIEPGPVRPGYRVYRIRYPSPVTSPVEANNTVPAEYFLPDGCRGDGPPRPAVVCLHILINIRLHIRHGDSRFACTRILIAI